jgi:hypothetical protein
MRKKLATSDFNIDQYLNLKILVAKLSAIEFKRRQVEIDRKFKELDIRFEKLEKLSLRNHTSVYIVIASESAKGGEAK